MASPTPASHSLAERYIPLARSLARWLASQVSGADVEDLEADGFLGLVKAEKGYDPDYGVSFPRYAKKFIIGAMRDGMGRDAPTGATLDGRDLPSDPEDDPAELAAVADDVRHVRENLGREPFSRARTEDLTGVAIAERVGISRPGASHRVRRARRLLDEMDREGAECN